MDPDLFRPRNWEQFLLTGQLFDASNRFVLESDADSDPDSDSDSAPMPPPIFVVGCGRSGTTLIGRLLAEHPSLLFLNEPRALWLSVFPELDVWSLRTLLAPPSRPPSLCPLRVADFDSARRRMRSLYRRLLRRSGKTRIVDKLPSHALRLSALRALFPKCHVIHVARHGLCVAASISRFSRRAWLGVDGHAKWKALRARVAETLLIRHFEPRIAESKQPLSLSAVALIEWTASVLSARRALRRNEKGIELKYEHITHRDSRRRRSALRALFRFAVGGDCDDIVDRIEAAHMIKVRRADDVDSARASMSEHILFDETRALLCEFDAAMAIPWLCDADCDELRCSRLLDAHGMLFVVGFGDEMASVCGVVQELVHSRRAEIVRVGTGVHIVVGRDAVGRAKTKITFKLRLV